MGNIGSVGLKRIYAGNIKIKQGYVGAQKVYSSGNIVTYKVDSSVTYAEEVDSDATCLAPSTFTPAKSGYTFVGWREDSTAGGTVLTEKTMGDDPITLYAVFRKTITLTLYNGSTTATKKTGYQYYNNGNIVNPVFTVAQAALSGWTARGWSKATTGNGSIAYSSLNGTAFSADTTLYGMYQQTITVTYYDSATAAKTTQGTRYYNSNGNAVNPTFTLTQSTQTGWTARGWSTSNSATGGISYKNGVAFTASANLTLYGMYYKTVTMTYNGNGSSGGSTATQSGTVYLCIYNTNIQPYTFTLASNGFEKDGYGFTKWAVGSASGTQYAAGAKYTTAASIVMYAVWEKLSEPWVAYFADGTTLGANSPATTPQYTGDYLLSTVYNQYMYICGGTGALSIKSKNVDGTNFLPTNGCNYMDVIVRADGAHQTVCVVTGKKEDGTETVILTETVPLYANNTKYVIDGVSADNNYPYNITDINVQGYVSIRVENYCNTTNSSGHSVGLGRMVFHD